MKYKAIIFDLFGTIVDNYSVQGYNSLLKDMASVLEVSVGDFSRLWRDTTYERGTGIFKTTEESIKYVCNILKVPINNEKILKCVQIRQENTRKALTPKKGAIDILINLRELGYKTGLISNCSSEVPLLWKNTVFFQFFNVTIFSASVGMKKPNPQIYNLACEQLGVKPKECLYIGDGDSNELSGASQFGMDVVMISDPNEKDPYHLVKIDWKGRKIENLIEVMDLI
ncbi:MAG: HAD family hydrolase [Promethearchaeota archaeon]